MVGDQDDDSEKDSVGTSASRAPWDGPANASPDLSKAELSPARRTARVIVGLRKNMDRHAAECGDEVLGFAVSPFDMEKLQIAEILGLPVLESDEMSPGRVELICMANSVLYKQFTTVDELQEDWYLQPPPVTQGAAD